MSAVQVVVADDDVLLREGLASLLDRSGFEVVGQAADATELLALVRDRKPQLVVVDIRMPPTHTTEGLDAARVIRAELPDTGILVLSAHVEVEHATELLASGHGIGYLLKTRVTDVADFVDTLERISKGASVVDPALVQELVSARRRDDPLAVLSAREQEVLMLMAEGRSNAGIARRLWVTEGTVEKHVRSILTKLNLPETGVDHRDVGVKILVILQCLSAIGCLDYADSRPLEHCARGIAEIGAIVNDQTAHVATSGNTHFSASQMSTIIAFPLPRTSAAKPRPKVRLSRLSQNCLATAIIEGPFCVEEAR